MKTQLFIFVIFAYIFNLNNASAMSVMLEEKVDAVTQFWAYSRFEYIKLTRLTEIEKHRLSRNQDSNESIGMLLALNCVSNYPYRHEDQLLYNYLCKDADYSSTYSNYITSFYNIYYFIFSKPEDRLKSIDYIKRYDTFLDHEESLSGLVRGVADKEFFKEVIEFLTKGGYDVKLEE